MGKVTIQTNDVIAYLDRADTDLRSAEVHGLYVILTKLVEQTKQNMLAAVPRAGQPIRPMKRKGSTYATKGDSMLDALRRSIHKKGDNIIEGTVHIMGSRDIGSGTFITRFFEGGTKVRMEGRGKGKKKKSHGKLNAYKFFSNAVNQANSMIDQLLMQSLEETINKLNAGS